MRLTEALSGHAGGLDAYAPASGQAWHPLSVDAQTDGEPVGVSYALGSLECPCLLQSCYASIILKGPEHMPGKS